MYEYINIYILQFRELRKGAFLTVYTQNKFTQKLKSISNWFKSHFTTGISKLKKNNSKE